MPSRSNRPSVTQATKKQPLRKSTGTSRSKALEGEGSYSATRAYNRHLADDLKGRDVEKSATKARLALAGEEGKQLRAAENKGKRGPFSKP